MLRPRTSLVLLALSALSACSFQASCGDAKTLNTKKLERTISKYVEKELGAAPEKVECPSKVALEEDGELDCTVTFNAERNETTVVHVVQTDAEGSVTYSFKKSVVSYPKLEAFIVQQLKVSKNIDATVECGELARDSKAGDKLDCIATDAAGAKASIAVTITDDSGNFELGAITPLPSQ